MTDPTTMQEHRHRAAQLLLPWYVAGTLDDEDRRTVDRHRRECAVCEQDVAAERRLVSAVAVDVPVAANGWRDMADRIANLELAKVEIGDVAPLAPAVPLRRPNRRQTHGLRGLFSRPAPLRWMVATQLAALIVLGFVSVRPAPREDTYRALGDAEAGHSGNVLAMFRPDASERLLRRTLAGVGARVVDGPTSAGAYVLRVPGKRRDEALTRLRGDAAVTMAEPIDPGSGE